MDVLNAMKSFVAVAECGGITAAAERLGCSKAIVSRTLSMLEDHLNVRLLNRTTRRVSLTEIGSEYLEHCRLIIEQNEEIESRFADRSLEPQGRLRISVPVNFGITHIVPLLADFMTIYPKITLDLELSDRFVDIIEEGMDLAIRIGATGPDSLIVRKLGESHLKLVAAPSLIRQHGGPPVDVNALRAWPMLSYTLKAHAPPWANYRIGTDADIVRTNNGEAIAKLAADGVGVAYLPKFLIGPELESGALQVLLEGIAEEIAPIYVLYPHRRRLALKSRVFIDFLAQKLADAEFAVNEN